MAASLARCRVCQTRKILHYIPSRKSTKSVYILLPEIPPDTAENNTLLRLNENFELSKLKPDNVITGCAKLAIQYDMLLGEHGQNLKDPNLPKEFETVFEPIEKVSVPMFYAWRGAKILGFAKGSEAFRNAYKRVTPQIQRSWAERWSGRESEALNNAVKELSANKANLTENQCRWVDMYRREARVHGGELQGKEQEAYKHTYNSLFKLQNIFTNKTVMSTSLFKHTIEDFEKVVNWPKSLIQNIAVDKANPGQGPWNVTLGPRVYQPFLEHCDQRMVRWNVWQAYQNRSSITQDSENLSNHVIIKDIRMKRQDLADLLGYDNWPDMLMDNTMAGSVENVISTIESLKEKFKPVADEEVARLEKFATSEGNTTPIELWDFPYWRRREREHMYGIKADDIMEYFPFQHVVKHLFALCEQLLDVKIEDATQMVDVWHHDVKYYKISENGTTIAGFYIDPYARPGEKVDGCWMEAIRERSDLLGTFPISYLHMNLTPPTYAQPSLMDLGELRDLFTEFGRGLQQLLTTVPYSEIAGMKNLERDTLEVSGKVMEMLLCNEHVVGKINCHYKTGEVLPAEKVQRIVASRKHFSSYDMMYQLYLGAYDMEVHISDLSKHWYPTMEKCWKEFMPIRRKDREEDNHPCSLTSVFGVQPMIYSMYTLMWSEMIAADIIGAFEEAGFEDHESVAQVGKRYRDTHLALGGGVPAGEVFRKFRGRDPSQDALFRYHNLS